MMLVVYCFSGIDVAIDVRELWFAPSADDVESVGSGERRSEAERASRHK